MSDAESFDELAPEEVHIEAIEGYHLGGTRYSASFELADHDENFFRSYLLDVDLGASLSFRILHQVDTTIMSHASLSENHHLIEVIGGRMQELQNGELSETRLPEGVLRRIFILPDGPQFVIGDFGVCYWREHIRGEWRLIPPVNDHPLRAIHGPSLELVHACGNSGTLLRFDRGQWVPVDLPDERSFNAIEVSPDGTIYLGGEDGTALMLRDGELVELAAPARHFFSICSFKGQRYWGDSNWGLNRQEGTEVAPFRELRYAFYMHASAEKLVISGWKEIFVFDGENWDGFQLNYDGNIYLTRLNMAEYGG